MKFTSNIALAIAAHTLATAGAAIESRQSSSVEQDRCSLRTVMILWHRTENPDPNVGIVLYNEYNEDVNSWHGVMKAGEEAHVGGLGEPDISWTLEPSGLPDTEWQWNLRFVYGEEQWSGLECELLQSTGTGQGAMHELETRTCSFPCWRK